MCAPFLFETPLYAISDIENNQLKAVAFSDGNDTVSMTLQSLSPLTIYDIYCYTDDHYSHVMTLEDAKNTLVRTTTKCCREIQYVTTSLKVIFQYFQNLKRPESPFQFKLNAQPTDDLKVAFTIEMVKCSPTAPRLGTTDALVYPSSLQFGKDSLSLLASVVVRGTVTGCYKLTATGTSRGSDQYHPVTVSFQLQSYRTTPVCPTLDVIRFSDLGKSLLYVFSSATDRGVGRIPTYDRSFRCSLVLSFPGSDLSTCKWINTLTVEAVFLSTKEAVVVLPNIGDVGTLFEGVIRAACIVNTDCKSYGTNRKTSRVIKSALHPIVPTPVLLAPTTIDVCDDINLDPTASKGFGGRRWSLVLWQVKRVAHGRNADVIEHYLNSRFNDTVNLISIPNEYFKITSRLDAGFEISLTVTNFLMQNATVRVVVTIDRFLKSTIIPQLRIIGGSLNTFRYKPVNLFASAIFPTCNEFLDSKTYNLLYNWKVYMGINFNAQIQSISADQRYFKLDPYSLNVSANYTIVVDVYSLTAPLSYVVITASASTRLYTGLSGVVAVISGGAQQTFGLTDDVKLDASESTFLDHPFEVLHYTWSCAVLYPDYGSPCSSNWYSPDDPLLYLYAGTLAAKNYNISVTVSNSFGQSDSKSVMVKVLAVDIPKIVVTNMRAKYNPDDKVIITAEITSLISGTKATWSSSDLDLNSLKAFARTPLNSILSTGLNMAQLSIAANSLTPGLTYSFLLTASYPTNTEATATISAIVSVNAPPLGGTMSVVPSQGYALSTTFFLSTVQWEDDPSDYPLMYRLSYYNLDPSKLITIKDADEVPYIHSFLGQGFESIQYNLHCVAQAIDVQGCSANVSTVVKVLPFYASNAKLQSHSVGVLGIGDVLSVTQGYIAAAVQDVNPTRLGIAIAACLSSINSVSCIVPRKCSKINRQACGTTAGTCGPCLAGLLGVPGDSNVPCNTTETINSIGGFCIFDYNCITGACQGGQCADVSKVCPTNCGGRGRCVAFDNHGNILPFCSILDTTCVVQCVCDRLRQGPDCSYIQSDYSTLTSFRNDLCINVKQLSALQDISSEVIRFRSVMVSDIFSDIDQVSSTALRDCGTLLISTISNNLDLCCSTSTFDAVISALSKILMKKGQQLPMDLLVTVSNTIMDLSARCQIKLAVGEDPTSLISNSLRLMNVLVDRSSVANQLFDTPLSSFESFNDKRNSYVYLTPADVSNSGSALVGLSAIVLDNDPTGVKSNSTQYSLRVTNYVTSSDVLPVDRRLTTVQPTLPFSVNLQNNKPIDYRVLEPSNFTFRCYRPFQDSRYELNGTCSSGLTFYLTCPANTKGVYEVNCPSFVTLPVCTVWNGNAFEQSQDCRVTAYSPDATTCYCDFNTKSGRYLLNSNAGYVQLSSDYTIDWVQYSKKFTAAPSKTNVKHNSVIFATLVTIMALFILGLLGFLRWDLNEIYKFDHTDDKQKRDHRVRTVSSFFNSIFPDELRDGPWYLRYWIRLQVEHPWICLWVPYYSSAKSRTLKWSITMGRLLIILFVKSVLASFLYADSGYCEDLIEEDKCRSAQSPGGYAYLCKWRTDNDSCEFQEPQADFHSTFILLVSVALLCVPLNAMWQYFSEHIASFVRYEASQKKVEVQPSKSTLDPKYDEFRAIQTRRGTLFRAARLEKVRKNMDFVLPIEEALIVVVNLEDDAEKWRNQRIFGDVIGFVPLTRARYFIEATHTASMDVNVSKVRRISTLLREELEMIVNQEEQEALLMKKFIVDLFTGYKRSIVSKYFLGEHYHSGVRTYSALVQQVASLILLPLGTIAMVAFIYLESVSLGSRSTNLWLLVTLLSIAQEIFLFHPFKIWLLWILIYDHASMEVRDVYQHLINNARIMLRRSAGIMRDSNALVQHFNPACRAARMFPELPISRLLLSLNDRDIPILPAEENLLRRIQLFMLASLFSVILLPELLQESVLGVVSCLWIDFGILLFHIIINFSTALFAIIIIVIVIIIAFVGFDVMDFVLEWFNDVEKRKFQKQRQFEIKHRFYDLDQDEIFDVSQDSKSDMDDAVLLFDLSNTDIFSKKELIVLKDGTKRVISSRYEKVLKLLPITEQNYIFNLNKEIDENLIEDIGELNEQQQQQQQQQEVEGLEAKEDDNQLVVVMESDANDSIDGDGEDAYDTVYSMNSYSPSKASFVVVDPSIEQMHSFQPTSRYSAAYEDDVSDMSSIMSDGSYYRMSSLHLPFRVKPDVALASISSSRTPPSRSKVYMPDAVGDDHSIASKLNSNSNSMRFTSNSPFNDDDSLNSFDQHFDNDKPVLNRQGNTLFVNSNSSIGPQFSVASEASQFSSPVRTQAKVQHTTEGVGNSSHIASFLFEDDDHHSDESSSIIHHSDVMKSLMDFNYDLTLWGASNKDKSESTSVKNIIKTISSSLVPISDEFSTALPMMNDNESDSVTDSFSMRSKLSNSNFTKPRQMQRIRNATGGIYKKKFKNDYSTPLRKKTNDATSSSSISLSIEATATNTHDGHDQMSSRSLMLDTNNKTDDKSSITQDDYNIRQNVIANSSKTRGKHAKVKQRVTKADNSQSMSPAASSGPSSYQSRRRRRRRTQQQQPSSPVTDGPGHSSMFLLSQEELSPTNNVYVSDAPDTPILAARASSSSSISRSPMKGRSPYQNGPGQILEIELTTTPEKIIFPMYA